MQVDKMVRDTSLRDELITVVDGKMMAKKDFDIHIPYRYVPSKLAVIGKYIQSVAIFALVSGNRYVVSNVTSMMELLPSNIGKEKIDGEDYYIFNFFKGDVVSPRLDLIVDDGVAYKIYNEFIGKAKLPWFIHYEDLGKCLASSPHYSNLKLSDTNAVIELLVASIARSPKDVKRYYREDIKSMNDLKTMTPVVLPFRAVISGTTNTMGKLIGSYFEEGITSALTDEGGPAGVEDLFRL